MEDSEDGQRPRWSGCFWPSSTDMTIEGHPYRCECPMPQLSNICLATLYKKIYSGKLRKEAKTLTEMATLSLC